MKKYGLVILLVMLLVSCQTETEVALVEPSEPISIDTYSKDEFVDFDLDHYVIEGTLNDEEKTIEAVQVLTYTNREGINLDRIYLHLYPNAFSKEGQPSIAGNTDGIDGQYGAIEIENASIDGVQVDFYEGPTISSIEIPYDFEMSKTYTLELKYKVKVSDTSERFGYVNDIYNLGNWYPILAVYDDEGWNVDPYLSIGDPFYSDMANYDVSLTVPNGFVVAASGYATELENGEETTYHFRGDRMRDFAMVISKDFEIMQDTVNGTEVYLYYPRSLKKHKWLDDGLTYGVESIRLFEEVIGDYPYKTYSVVLTNFPSGMEYPGLVFISKGYLMDSMSRFRTVIVHETVHQWFYNIIGDDEVDEGWIDEGLTTYFTAYFEKETIDHETYEATMNRYRDRVDSYGFDNIIVAQSAYEFSNWTEYGVSAYSKSSLVYHELYMKYGDQKIREFAKHLYDNYAYEILREEDLRASIIEVFGEDAEKILLNWWY